MMNNIFPKLHKEGYKFLAISIIITFIVWVFSNFLATIMLLITIWVYYFFRDPDRVVINDNCHVNRIPIEGKIEEIFYKPGKFLNASLDKASKENERNYYKIKTNNGEELIIVQIAGLIARRIVCEVSKDQNLKQGDRIGMIRFGSRVDLFFNNKKPIVKIGQNVLAGESLLAKE
jgi:phosphatidylserine decarboxylase